MTMGGGGGGGGGFSVAPSESSSGGAPLRRDAFGPEIRPGDAPAGDFLRCVEKTADEDGEEKEDAESSSASSRISRLERELSEARRERLGLRAETSSLEARLRRSVRETSSAGDRLRASLREASTAMDESRARRANRDGVEIAVRLESMKSQLAQAAQRNDRGSSPSSGSRRRREAPERGDSFKSSWRNATAGLTFHFDRVVAECDHFAMRRSEYKIAVLERELARDRGTIDELRGEKGALEADLSRMCGLRDQLRASRRVLIEERDERRRDEEERARRLDEAELRLRKNRRNKDRDGRNAVNANWKNVSRSLARKFTPVAKDCDRTVSGTGGAPEKAASAYPQLPATGESLSEDPPSQSAHEVPSPPKTAEDPLKSSGDEALQRNELQRRPNDALAVTRRVGTAVGGGALVALGVAMIPLPLPLDVVLLPAGIALLGTEFPAVGRASEELKENLGKRLERMRGRGRGRDDKNQHDDDDAGGEDEAGEENSIDVVEEPSYDKEEGKEAGWPEEDASQDESMEAEAQEPCPYDTGGA
mmetsp:Transcript_28578/g.84141  ORF Transcript_28578/g.84141 Transcript_28578/m.84141 type:complete len:536 (-) Transcript_28578:119-1726(-)